MGKSATERQAAYRARRPQAGDKGDGERRLNMWVSTAAGFALARLAHRYGVTQRAMVERLLIAEDDRILADIASDSAAWEAYLNRATLRSNESAGHPGEQGIEEKKEESMDHS